MANGPFRWFNSALDKIADGSLLLGADPFKAVLCGAAQALDETFVGSSTDCRYADLTDQLATANGYTNGGLALTSETLSRVANVVKFTASPLVWTLTGVITYKYCVIFCDNGNDDLLCLLDANTASGVATSSPFAGAFTITPHANGIVGWERP
jgi:hypothetical protein